MLLGGGSQGAAPSSPGHGAARRPSLRGRRRPPARLPALVCAAPLAPQQPTPLAAHRPPPTACCRAAGLQLPINVAQVRENTNYAELLAANPWMVGGRRAGGRAAGRRPQRAVAPAVAGGSASARVHIKPASGRCGLGCYP